MSALVISATQATGEEGQVTAVDRWLNGYSPKRRF